ncbi:MAG: hypothetical protein JWM35_2224, partial [Verrucomicrobia bacterium]|nr:hypothetical protein [Verrucomicrobiota bacterium]
VEANPAALLENGANVWPDESAESLFLSGQKEQEAPAVATSAVEVSEETDGKPLPALEDLVKKIPAEIRATIDELFRAKFVSVKRIPKSALKELSKG